MSKQRRPHSRQFAVAQAVEFLGIEVAAEITGLSCSHLRATSDPDRAREISLRAAESLDRALIEHGEEPVNYAAYGRRLEVASQSETAIACLKRALTELEHAERLLETYPDDALHSRDVDRLLIRLARKNADLWQANCERRERT